MVSITISQNPIVSKPVPAAYNLNLQRVGNINYSGYRHSIADLGGYLTAGFSIEGPEDTLSELIENGLARHVEVYDKYGIQRWEGIAHSYELITSLFSYKVSLEKVVNKLWLRTTLDDNTEYKTAVANNLVSQARYGILERVFSMPEAIEDAVRPEDVRDMMADELDDPHKQGEHGKSKGNIKFDRGPLQIGKAGRGLRRGRAILKVGCVGYYWYLKRRVYNAVTDNSLANANVVILAIINDIGEFVNNSKLVTNAQQVRQFVPDDEIAWDVITSFIEDGSSNRHVVGMYNDRRFVYEQRTVASAENLEYREDGQGVIRNKDGARLNGIEMLPNRYIYKSAVLVSPGKYTSDIRSLPPVGYINRVDFTEGQGARLSLLKIGSGNVTINLNRLRKAMEMGEVTG